MNSTRGEGGMPWILIGFVLALIVLAVFAFGFIDTSRLFGSNTKAYGETNVQSQVQACNIACSSGESGRYKFCTLPRTVNFGQAVDNAENGRVIATCDKLADDYSSSGFTKCPNWC